MYIYKYNVDNVLSLDMYIFTLIITIIALLIRIIRILLKLIITNEY